MIGPDPDRRPPAVHPFGDAAFLVPTAGLRAARALSDRVEQARRDGSAPPGIVEAVAGFDSVVVRFDPEVESDTALSGWLAALAAPSGPGPVHPGGRGTGRTVTIAVAFDGPDLDEVATSVGATTTLVAELLTGTALEVALLGFAPGFPYLVGLPPALAAVPRRPTPRPAVRAGAVAVAGGFAAVYPRASPGGWMVLGHTTSRLFDPERPPYALLRPGDRVRFSVERAAPTVGSRPPPGARGPESRPPLAARGHRVVEVLEPGLLTLVEDAGRRGVAGLGVPTAGPADPDSMRLANTLVGNAADAACLEVTGRGPALRFGHPGHVAVVAGFPAGVEVELDGHPVGPDLVVPVQAGQTLAVGRVRAGLRAYVALSGGIRTPPVVGSRSSDQLSGLGHGPLQAGDRLELGPAARPHGRLSRPPGAAAPAGPIRVVLGPHPFPARAVESFLTADWSVGADSNRIGLRLEGGPPLRWDRPPITSTGMVTGAVQVPPDGKPIVLMVDHATLGGYPVLAGVISADLPRLGQARPGDRLAFTPIDPAEARRTYRRQTRALADSVSGWFPTAAAT